ncbi:hypothetical protein D3C87_1592330 [compost metagenome]
MMSDKINDIALNMSFCGRGDAHRFIQSDINDLAARFKRFTIYQHLITRSGLTAQYSTLSVDGHPPVLYKLVCFTA